MILFPKATRSASPVSNIIAAGVFGVNDIFILAIVLLGISGQMGVTVGAYVKTGTGIGIDRAALVAAPADAATTPIAAVVTT